MPQITPLQFDPDAPMTEVEAAKFVGVHRRTLRRYEVEDGLPVHRLGSSGRGPKRYFRDELTAWMRRNRWFGIAADNEGADNEGAA